MSEDFDLAISDLNDAIARDPQTAYRFDLLVSCHIDRGYLRLRTKQCDAAIADFSKVIGTDRGAEPCLVSRSFVRRGRAYFVAGLYDLAIVDFTEALSLHPGNADACCGRGKAWSAKGEHVHAIADFTTVIQNRPLDIDAYRFRALAWQAIDDRDAAARDLTRALSVASEAWTDTESTAIDLACAHVLMCAGRTDAARSLYLKCRGELDCGKFESAFVLPPTWEQKILADFAELDKVGLHHSLMDEIAATFLRSGRAGFDRYGSYHRPAK